MIWIGTFWATSMGGGKRQSLAARFFIDTDRFRKAELEQQEQYLRAQQDDADEAAGMKEIKGSLDIDDEQVAGFVLARSVKDASIRSAWTNRRDNPAAFTRVVAALRGGLEEYVEQQRRKYQNQEAVADRDAVASAVRGANLSRPLPEPGPDFGRMTDREFQQWKNENMRP